MQIEGITCPRSGSSRRLTRNFPQSPVIGPWREIEFLIRPPALCPDAGVFRKNFVHRPLKCRYPLSRTNPSKESPNERFMRFNKAKVSVTVFLVMTTADPECKGFVHNVQYPAPVFRDWLCGLKSFGVEAFLEEIS